MWRAGNLTNAFQILEVNVMRNINKTFFLFEAAGYFILEQKVIY